MMAAALIEPLSAGELHARDKSAQLIDVRTPAEFAASHIEGSRNVPLDSLDPSRVWDGLVGLKTPITVVCATGVRANKAADKLAAAGFEAVNVLKGGLKGWAAAGLPVGIGESRAISLERQVRIAAGSLVVLGLLLAWAVTPYAALLSLFVGAGLVFSGVTDTCGMGLLLAKAPWNRA